MLHWRTPETRVLLTVALLLAAGVLPWLIWSPVAMVAAGLVLCPTALAWLLLALHRDLRRTLERERAETQALVALHHLLEFRLPLPPLTGWAASPQLALEVASRILEARPSVVVELGSGSSTLVAATALGQNGEGHLWSMDHDEHYLGETAARVRAHGLDEQVTLRHAALKVQDILGRTRRWYDTQAFADLPPIDLLVVDGPPEQSEREARGAAFEVLGPRLKPGAVVIVDDAFRADERRAIERFGHERPGSSVRWIHSAKGIAVIQVSGTEA